MFYLTVWFSLQALHWAADKGHVAVVEVLVEQGADVHQKNCEGCTAADIAYTNRNDKVS